jgi:DNA adenine methylase
LVPTLAPALRAQLVSTGGRCVSLFYGSVALEQAAFAGATVLAAEANQDLVALYSQLARDPARVWRALLFLDSCSRRKRDGEGAYRRVAAASLSSPLERAARFLWLSSLSWSGMWRVNSFGAFNVPPDRARLARPWPFPGLRVFERAAEAVRGTTFVADWRDALAVASPGDIVLADPPYSGGFVDYAAARFTDADQEELATALRSAAACGVLVAAFNSPSAAHWYEPPWETWPITRSGRVSARADRRGKVSEFVATLGWRPTDIFEAQLTIEAAHLGQPAAEPETRSPPCTLVASRS